MLFYQRQQDGELILEAIDDLYGLLGQAVLWKFAHGGKRRLIGLGQDLVYHLGQMLEQSTVDGGGAVLSVVSRQERGEDVADQLKSFRALTVLTRDIGVLQVVTALQKQRVARRLRVEVVGCVQ